MEKLKLEATQAGRAVEAQEQLKQDVERLKAEAAAHFLSATMRPDLVVQSAHEHFCALYGHVALFLLCPGTRLRV